MCKKVFIILFVLIIFLSACSNNQTTTTTNNTTEMKLNEFAQKYDVPVVDISISEYLIDVQDKIPLNKNFVTQTTITNIYRDNGEIIINAEDWLGGCKFILECSEDLYKKIQNEKISSIDGLGVLINLSNLEKPDFRVTGDGNNGYDLEFNSECLIGKGNCIDFINLSNKG